MLRETQPQITLWDAALPPELTQLSPELARVDKILDDDRFLAPYRRRFSKRIGRPTIPLDTFLRLMYLKFRYGLGYETLVREVSDSVMWRFCRIPLNQLPPHPTTLIKLVKRCGPETLRELNELLVQKAREEKLIRGRKLRVDTTAVQANIRYPTDAGLLADGIKLVTRAVKRIQASGVAATVRFRNSTRAAKKRVLEIAKVLRRRTADARAEVDQVTAKMVVIGRRVARQAGKVVSQAKAELSRGGAQCAVRVERLVDRLERGVALLGQAVAHQSRWWRATATSPTGWSACSIRMPGRSGGGGSRSPPSSVTRWHCRKWKTVSSRGTKSLRGIHRMRSCCLLRSSAMSGSSGDRPRNLPPTVASPAGARRGSLRSEGSSTCASRTEATRVLPARCLSDRHGSGAWRGGGQGARAGSAF